MAESVSKAQRAHGLDYNWGQKLAALSDQLGVSTSDAIKFLLREHGARSRRTSACRTTVLEPSVPCKHCGFVLGEG